MVIRKQEIILGDNSQIGPKTLNLKKLKHYGFNVPDFLVVSAETVEVIYDNDMELVKVCERISTTLPRKAYAVRSSAFGEDSRISSMAGQFQTKIKVHKQGLSSAIRTVIQDAKGKLHDKISGFSLIVQEYIETEYSGVCFTRNPNGEREMVIEYHKGIGEDLVDGRIVPLRDAFYRHQDKKILGFSVNIFKSIEEKFGCPQDIEWGIKNGQMYFFQTRPITTISKKKYTEILFLDKTLSKTVNFFLEKNEIAEIAPRPTPFTVSLLEKIHGNMGPVQKIYKKHHISYFPQDIFRILGNELFIDRELETKTILPSCSILNKHYGIRLHTLQKFFTTIKNVFFISTIKELDNIAGILQKALEDRDEYSDLHEILNKFLYDYQIVFEISIFASKYLRILQNILKKEPVTNADILGMHEEFFTGITSQGFNFQFHGTLFGNSLEISDETPFYSIQTYSTKMNDSVVKRWRSLPRWKSHFYGKYIHKALLYQRYREYSRILMIKNLNMIRDALLHRSPFKETRNIYFHTISEILGNALDEKICLSRKIEYSTYKDFELPAKLTHNLVMQRSDRIGVSSGIAHGVLVTEKTIRSGQKDQILYVKMLSATLTKYFTDITGIISENGGLLSHLAIIAREKGIPVIIVQYSTGLRIGDYIEIDGSTGSIRTINHGDNLMINI